MFPRKVCPRSYVLPVIKIFRVVLVATICLLCLHDKAAAVGTFIPATMRVDMVYDSTRDIVYITNGSSVLRYHLSSNAFLTPFELGGNLSGIDLSPDGNTLIVADRQRSASHVWVHVVDLRTGLNRKAMFPLDFGEGGTFTAVFANDGSVIITSTYEGSGWVYMRRYHPGTGESSKIALIRQDTMIASSGDGSVVGFAESNISDGRFGRYRVTDRNIFRRDGYTYGTGWFNYEIGVNKNGTQFAIPTYGGTHVYDASLNKLTTVGQYAGPQPIGVVYHPVEDIVYFAWAGSTEVRAHETTSFAQVAAYDFEHTFTHPGNRAFTQGRLKLSPDGSLLFATVDGGVRYLRLYDPLVANEQSVSTDEDTAIPITLTGNIGNGGGLTYSVVTNPTHGTLSGVGPNLIYTPDATYNGPDSFTYKTTYGRAESAVATVAITVNPLNNSPVADDQVVTINWNRAKAITLSGSDVEGSELIYSIVSPPAHGALSGTGPALTYTPAANYIGGDSFTFRVNDGTADSNIATVMINVKSPPRISFNHIKVKEGNTGTASAIFNVKLSAPSDQTVTVMYATASGTAITPDDYTAVPPTVLSFAPGEVNKTVTVEVKGDTLQEREEIFFLNLSAATDAVISIKQATCTILDNDKRLRISDVTMTEGASPTSLTKMAFTVTLSAPSAVGVSVSFATADGSAAAGTDYQAIPPTLLTFSPGQTSKTINVLIKGDTKREYKETLFLNLSAPINAIIADGRGVGSIINED